MATETKPALVCFIHAPKAGMVNITADPSPHALLERLQPGAWEELYLLVAIPGGRGIEEVYRSCYRDRGLEVSEGWYRYEGQLQELLSHFPRFVFEPREMGNVGPEMSPDEADAIMRAINAPV